MKFRKFYHAVNIVSYLFSAISIAAVVAALNFQSEIRNVKELTNPTGLYLVLLGLFGVFFVSLLIARRKQRNGIQYYFPPLIALFTVITWIEGSLFSEGYYEPAVDGLHYYVNYEIVNYLNSAWVVSSLILFILNLIPVVIMLIGKLRRKRHASVRYREKCYKRVSQVYGYYEAGIISKEEYEKTRKEILKEIE